jgi:ceramide glucosyltransferase
VIVAVATVVVIAGLGANALMAWAARRQLTVSLPPACELPPVSILKPLKGTDAGLAANLESIFRLAYPRYEVILGVADADDPALAVARRVAAAHPEVPSRLVADSREVGLNPKVNNLANLARYASHDVLLISDSNIRVRPGYLADLVTHLVRPGVGLVSSPFRAVAAGGTGGAIEALQLNTFVLGGVAALHRLLGGVCVVGKSMLLRRTTLEAIGGFAFLARYLAEDQVCGEEVARRGLAISVSGHVIDNVLGTVSLRSAVGRHLRWARIRRRMSPAGYAGELLLQPVFLAAIAAVADPGLATALLLAATVAARAAVDAAAERAAGVRRPLAVYALLSAARDLVVGAVWAVPLVSSTVRWRGRTFAIGPRTLLVGAGVPDSGTAGRAGEPVASAFAGS